MKENNNLFLPIYVNKDRLLDINLILFDGYSEFSEMTLENEGIGKKDNKSSVNSGIGMKIFSLGSELSSNEELSQTNKEKISLKKIQTISSLLANTLSILKTKKLIKMADYKVGNFIEITGKFRNNSICDLLDQFTEMMSFVELANKLSGNKTNEYAVAKDQIKQVKQMIKRKDDLERELVYNTDDDIYVIHLQTGNIYNSNIDDIYSNELTYFCQIKSISKDYNFFSDTQLSKIDKSLLSEFINSLKTIVEQSKGQYDFNLELLNDSGGKQVYELELVAIYRKTN